MGQSPRIKPKKQNRKDPNICLYVFFQKDYYTSGQVVKGIVCLDVMVHTSQYIALALTLAGKESIRFQYKAIDTETGNEYFTYNQKSKETYQDSFKLMDFDKQITKGQYTVPFEFLLPDNLPGSFSLDKDNYIEYRVEPVLIHYSQRQRDQKQPFGLNIFEAKPKQSEFREEYSRQFQFCESCGCCGCCGCCKYGDIKLSLQCNTLDELHKDQIKVYGKIQNRSNKKIQRFSAKLVNKMSLDFPSYVPYASNQNQINLDIGSKLIEPGQDHSFEILVKIPQKNKGRTAIGQIIANYYQIQVNIITFINKSCMSNNFPIPVYNLKPTFATTKKKDLPNLWLPIQAPRVSMMQMKPYCWRNTFEIGFKNLDSNKRGIPPKFEDENPESANRFGTRNDL